MSNDIQIEIIKNEPRTDSRLLAGLLDHRHRTILENIDRNLDGLGELGPIPFQTEKGKALDHGGYAKSIRYAMLNEDQCYFLLTLMRNNERVIRAKLDLVKAFRDMRRELANRDLARIEGKKARLGETTAIKALVDYASANGASKPEWYYATITRMTNKLLCIDAKTRDDLDAEKLKQLGVVETVVELAIREGIRLGLNYKAIYLLAKERANMLSGPLAVEGPAC